MDACIKVFMLQMETNQIKYILFFYYQTESQLKLYNHEMSKFRMKSTFIIALFMIITVSSFGQIF